MHGLVIFFRVQTSSWSCQDTGSLPGTDICVRGHCGRCMGDRHNHRATQRTQNSGRQILNSGSILSSLVMCMACMQQQHVQAVPGAD